MKWQCMYTLRRQMVALMFYYLSQPHAAWEITVFVCTFHCLELEHDLLPWPQTALSFSDSLTPVCLILGLNMTQRTHSLCWLITSPRPRITVCAQQLFRIGQLYLLQHIDHMAFPFFSDRSCRAVSSTDSLTPGTSIHVIPSSVSRLELWWERRFITSRQRWICSRAAEWQASLTWFRNITGAYKLGVRNKTDLLKHNEKASIYERSNWRGLFCQPGSGLGWICQVVFSLWLMRKLWAWHLIMDVSTVIHASAAFPHTVSPFEWLRAARRFSMNFSFQWIFPGALFEACAAESPWLSLASSRVPARVENTEL